MQAAEPTLLHPAGTPLPTRVAERLAQFGEQLKTIEALRQQYLQGVVETLDLPGRIQIDLATMTYRVQEVGDE